MRRAMIYGLSVCACLLMASLSSSAQAQGVQRPTVSPYLNLLRSTGTPAENYYTLVRPEISFRQSLQQQNRQIQQLRRQSASTVQGQARTTPGPAAIPGTGHSSFFQTYSHYYFFPATSRR